MDQNILEIIQKIEPYFSAISWVDKGKKTITYGPIDPPTDPKQKFFLTLDLDTGFFERHAKFNYFKLAKNDSSKTWWDDGMQREVVNTIHAVADDLDEGVFLIYCAMNSQNYPMFLGRLKPEDDFTVAVANRLRTLVAL